jgi:hypothetical protein
MAVPGRKERGVKCRMFHGIHDANPTGVIVLLPPSWQGFCTESETTTTGDVNQPSDQLPTDGLHGLRPWDNTL